jgi:phosphoribosylformylglycinamidine synthase
LDCIKRVYVEKKNGLDTEAKSVFDDLTSNLNVSGLQGVRVLNCYDFLGIESRYLEICKKSVFSEPPVDNLYEDEINFDENETAFRVKYLPGQFDQRADSCVQCIQTITGSKGHKVEASKIYVLKGNIGDGLVKIKKYLINPIDSMEAPLEKPDSLDILINEPDKIKNIDGFIFFDDRQIAEFHKSNQLAMSILDLSFVQSYFKDEEKRDPTETEIKVIDTYWSDHCRHTTFSTILKDINIEEGKYSGLFNKAFELYKTEHISLHRDKITLMDMATIGMKSLKEKNLLKDLDESEEINACSIVIDVNVSGKTENYLLMFKNETHNHPTEIEPFGGAATCLGGAIRDPLSGRSYVYQAMRITGSGDPRAKIEDTLPYKLPQRKITKVAADGYSSYGNQIGIATGYVKEIYHEGYVAKRMEAGAVIGAAKKAMWCAKGLHPAIL